jgi:hypothetical protein
LEQFAGFRSGKIASSPRKGVEVTERDTLSDEDILTTGSRSETEMPGDDDSTDSDTGDDSDDMDADSDDMDA